MPPPQGDGGTGGAMRSNFHAKQFVRAKGEDANVRMCHLVMCVSISEPKHQGGPKRWEDAS